jgi:hypothetical protein
MSQDLANIYAKIRILDRRICCALNGASSLPTQTGHTGEFLSTNGTSAFWDAVDLQTVTTSGNNTTDQLEIFQSTTYPLSLKGPGDASNTKILTIADTDRPARVLNLSIKGGLAGSDATFDITFPRASGNLALSVNGNTANAAGDITLSQFTLPSLTAGSILFSDGATISQNNSKLFWDNTNHQLLINSNTANDPISGAPYTARFHGNSGNGAFAVNCGAGSTIDLWLENTSTNNRTNLGFANTLFYIGLNGTNRLVIFDDGGFVYGNSLVSGSSPGANKAAFQTNVLIGGVTSGASATNTLHIYDGTAPTGNITNGVMLYSAAGELKVRDSAGNVTTLSPHNFSGIPSGASEPLAWSYYSEKDGEYVNVDMLKLARILEDLTGEKLVYTGKL